MPLYIVMGFRCKKRIAMLDKDGNKIPKKYHINLNNYRNWHPHVSNNIKKRYKDIAQQRLNASTLNFPQGFVVLDYTLYRGDKRKIDRANVLSIHEKFFCDALVELGFIPDDNDDHIESSHFYSGCIDRDNPRVDILIKER
jgi:hypothetical protein